jgi:pantetheine-phosphate adenylyltransferase
MRTAIYPGSFDPLTNGHLDVLERATKNPLYTIEERLALMKPAIAPIKNARADIFEGLLVEYAAKQKAQAIVRGLRAVSDFEFEFQMALMNRKLAENIETIFMMPKETYTFISSRMIKEIARLGGDISPFVPRHVVVALKKKLAL